MHTGASLTPDSTADTTHVHHPLPHHPSDISYSAEELALQAFSLPTNGVQQHSCKEERERQTESETKRQRGESKRKNSIEFNNSITLMCHCSSGGMCTSYQNTIIIFKNTISSSHLFDIVSMQNPPPQQMVTNHTTQIRHSPIHVHVFTHTHTHILLIA